MNGEFRAGDRLIESDLATRLDVSRATVRAALRRLESEGLVEVRNRRGTVVARMSLNDAEEVCEIRGILEGRAARQACSVLTDDDLKAMRHLAHEMRLAIESSDIFRLAELDIAFHNRICRGTSNDRLYTIWATSNAQLGALMTSILEAHRLDSQIVVDQHVWLCEALSKRDPDHAEEAVIAHYVDDWYLVNSTETGCEGMDE